MKKLIINIIAVSGILLLSLQIANAQNIIVKAGKQSKTLTKADIQYLNRVAPASVVKALDNFKTGGMLQYNAAADVILAILRNRK